MRYLSDDYILLIGGDGPLGGELEAQIQQHDLQDRVKLLGFIPGKLKPAYFGACDVFCLSSILNTEAYAIVLIEAMSPARPVIATKIPESGVSWVNADGVSGINVPIEDSAAMADAIRTICEDPALWEKYSRGARARFYDVFTKDEMINNLIEIYTDLLNK